MARSSGSGRCKAGRWLPRRPFSPFSPARTFASAAFALLDELHGKDYERMIVVGHSLGSILAYDLISYLWARRAASRTFVEETEDFEALRQLEEAVARLDKEPSPKAVAAFRQAQRTLSELLRRRARPNGDEADARWLITDLVTLGSLTHAEFLLAQNADKLQNRIARDGSFPRARRCASFWILLRSTRRGPPAFRLRTIGPSSWAFPSAIAANYNCISPALTPW
jgi:pimeloyl-ACP methyl ester carboxylesterase